MVWIDLKGRSDRSLELEEKGKMLHFEMESGFFGAINVVLFHLVKENKKWI